MTVLEIFKYPLIIILIIVAVNTSSKGLLEGLISLFVMLLFASYFVFRDKIEFFLEKKGWQKFYWYESLANGGIKEASLYRPLLDYEKQILDWQFQSTKDKNLDLDRRSPVFRVVGNLLKNGEGESEVALVRGLEITKENYPGQNYQLFADYTDVAVEFSPFSNKIWDIYRLVGEKRNWYFHLPENLIKQIREGTKTVDLRAPFGDHNLRELKRGDVISYIANSRVLLNAEITNVRYFRTLKQALTNINFRKIMPEAQTEKDLVTYLNTLPSYLPRINQYGVFLVEVKPAS